MNDEGIFMDMNQSVTISKEVVARKNQDGTVVVMRLDESSLFYKIDGIAAQVWESLTHAKKTSELIKEFQALYPDNKADLEKDIPLFVSEVLNKNLVIKC